MVGTKGRRLSQQEIDVVLLQINGAINFLQGLENTLPTIAEKERRKLAGVTWTSDVKKNLDFARRLLRGEEDQSSSR